MITEDYCDFETAKLLKEKGFDEKVISFYPPGNIQRPTLQMVCKWLREVHNIFVCIVLLEDIDGYGFTIKNTINKKYIATSKNDGYSTYEEAVEAAIKYCLENLI